jgi:hypothetical protein
MVKFVAIVDHAFLAPDQDGTVQKGLSVARAMFPTDSMMFCNGGDRSDPNSVAEYPWCQQLNIQQVFGVGGAEKTDSSSRINEALGLV